MSGRQLLKVGVPNSNFYDVLAFDTLVYITIYIYIYIYV